MASRCRPESSSLVGFKLDMHREVYGSALISLPAHVGVGTRPRTRVLPSCAAGLATRERRVEAVSVDLVKWRAVFFGGFNVVAEPEGV